MITTIKVEKSTAKLILKSKVKHMAKLSKTRMSNDKYIVFVLGNQKND